MYVNKSRGDVKCPHGIADEGGSPLPVNLSNAGYLMAKLVRQAAAIPIRGGRICMVRARDKGLVIAKGCLERGRTAEQMALQEAWEEAGILGIVQGRPLGSYRYTKAGIQFKVKTFLMEVITVVKSWPESHWRSRHWLLPDDAARRTHQRGLCRLLCQAGRDLAQRRRRAG